VLYARFYFRNWRRRTGILHGVTLELETSDTQFLTHDTEGMRNILALGQGERQVFMRIWRVDRRLLS